MILYYIIHIYIFFFSPSILLKQVISQLCNRWGVSHGLTFLVNRYDSSHKPTICGSFYIKFIGIYGVNRFNIKNKNVPWLHDRWLWPRSHHLGICSWMLHGISTLLQRTWGCRACRHPSPSSPLFFDKPYEFLKICPEISPFEDGFL